MALADITKEAVDSAILEIDQLGAASFLAKYGFVPAKRYWIELDGKRYPSKAIAGVAHKYIDDSQILPSASFTGGEASVGRKLRKFGFVIDSPERNPAWSRDELVLALDLYFTSPANPPGKGSSAVRALSVILNKLHRLNGVSGASALRNENGVYLKMINLRSLAGACAAC